MALAIWEASMPKRKTPYFSRGSAERRATWTKHRHPANARMRMPSPQTSHHPALSDRLQHHSAGLGLGASLEGVSTAFVATLRLSSAAKRGMDTCARCQGLVRSAHAIFTHGLLLGGRIVSRWLIPGMFWDYSGLRSRFRVGGPLSSETQL